MTRPNIMHIMLHNISTSSAISWLMFLFFILLYICLYTWRGLDNNDTGFILGLAHQLYLGGKLYDDVVYIRPPVSPIIHSIVFYPPFSFAPIFVDRIVFFLQIAIYNAISAIIGKRFFNFSIGFSGFIAITSFLWSAHAFPPMAWHTVDGIFFSVISLYFFIRGLDKSSLCLSLSAVFAIIAAGSKQSFYVTPIMLLMLCFLINNYRAKEIIIYSGSCILSSVALLIFFQFFWMGSVDNFLTSISSETNFHDLFNAGFANYVKDFFSLKSIVGIWPIFFSLAIGVIRNNKDVHIAVMTLSSVWIAILVVANFYLSADTWSQPLSVFNSLFIVTLLYSFAMLIKTHDVAWLIVISMHSIAWSSSISWGYKTTILYAAPSVLTLSVLIRPVLSGIAARVAAVSIIPASFIVFYLAHTFNYSLEGTIKTASLNSQMEGISAKLRYIYNTKEQIQLYEDLMILTRNIYPNKFIVLPNIPLAHMLAGTTNPIGIDWVLNGEIGESKWKILNKIDSNVDYAIVFRNASPSPDSNGKFGSDITIYITKKWNLIHKTEHFDIFRNPSAMKN